MLTEDFFAGGTVDVSRAEFDALKARMTKLEQRIADASRAGFAWAAYMVHGSPESVTEVRRLVEGRDDQPWPDDFRED